ncbi:MAG: bifunctional ADP-dependent (S)-NAD(P)H-hydrate dehydratase/NAD(P)H-hydrate epimerase [Rhizobiales bacterium 65-9]|nr:MAG: bifunctional ADP-dependent (S)-NAD(P)H-hydrate dehydratase/NAD(P)H-hydrate epimerase [Rhizobiales bacterium 65-9]
MKATRSDEAETALRLLSVAAMYEADRAAIAAGTTGAALMERAGSAVAARVAAIAPAGGRIAVFCGPGANGGDGFVAARLLREEGFSISLGLLGDAADIKGDARAARESWTGPIAAAASVTHDSADLVIDALFGAGLSRDLDGEARMLVERINASGRPVLAVDLPSGVSGDSGAIRGVAIRAAETVTFVRRKPGHLLLPGRALCGTVTVADIGISDAVVDAASPALFANAPALWRAALPSPGIDAHKYARGHLLVVAGGIEGVGAPRLSARAGLRAGAGLVTIAAPEEALAAHAARGPDALMLRRASDAAELRALLADPRRNAVVLGPALGLDQGARRKADVALASGAACVLDADALTLLSDKIDSIAPAAGRKPVVLTPHEGEFLRLFRGLFDKDQNGIERSKTDRAAAAAALTGAVVVLKGADTVIAAPDGRAAINENAPPWLATAGSGDVLAGTVGALLARGAPGFEAACAAVWIHGEAARRLGAGLIADDLPDEIGRVAAAL